MNTKTNIKKYIPWLLLIFTLGTPIGFASYSPIQSLIFEKNGNVGIGKMPTQDRLEVEGNIKASGDICSDSYCLNTTISNISEEDPIYLNDPASGISETQITNWNTAHSWGNHANAGYMNANTDNWVDATGDDMTGTLGIRTNDALSFKDGKHWITYNDGNGNFNIRVGNFSDTDSVEKITEDGYAFHQEYSQSNGKIEFNISQNGITGDAITWQNNMTFSPSGFEINGGSAGDGTTNGFRVDNNGNIYFDGALYFPGDVFAVSAQELDGSSLPSQTGTFNIGSSTQKWKDAFFSGTGKFDGDVCTSSTCLNDALTSETDPKIKILTGGKWCTSNGTVINCTTNPPVVSETDPQVGTLTNGKWCTTNGSSVNCTSNAPVTTESDPTVTASVKDGVDFSELLNGTGKYLNYKPNNTACSNNQVLKYNTTNSRWTCANDANTNTQLTEAQVDTYVANNGYLTSYTETDPQVGANTLNVIPKWNGSALASGTIFDNGNVGIGTSSPSERLEVNGNVLASAFLYPSDKRLKENIDTLDIPLEKIMQMRGVSFSWKKDGTRDIGFIAQEVEEYFPELVHTNEKSGLKSVKYGNMTAILLETIQEQEKNITEQQQEIQKLRSDLKEIQEILSDLQSEK